MAVVSADQIIPTKQSAAEDWIAWYQSFPWTMAQADKNNLFLAIWHKHGDSSANTNSLRTFLKGEGIELSTDGIGTLVDIGTSTINTIGSVFKFSGYAALALLLVWCGILGFGIVMAFRNPEATGKIIGVASKTAMEV